MPKVRNLVAAPALDDYRGVLGAVYGADRNFVHPDIGLLSRLVAGRSAFTGRGSAQPFAVRHHGAPAAFAVAFIDPCIQRKTGWSTGSIGFLEAVDADAACLVIDAACAWLAEHGVTEVWAPFNGNAYNGMGTREDRFDEPPFLGCDHHSPAMREYLLVAGFELVNRYLNFAVDLGARPWERFADVVASVPMRRASRWSFRREVLQYTHLHNAAFRTVWGEVEAGDDELLQMMMRSRLAIDPKLFLFAQDGGRDIGFVLSMPNLSAALAPLHVPLTSAKGMARLALARRRVDTVGLLSLGVDPAHQGGGIGTALVAESCRAAADLGYRTLEYALVAENNEPSKATALRFGGRLHRSFGIYRRALS
ncbi:MAG: GNAT family N-acetyltransferase [Acidimicrobiales bacterium]